MEKTLPEWLLEKMEEKGMNAAELSRRSGISAPQITRLLSGQRGVSEVSLRAISEALNIPPEEAFRVAGFLPPVPERTEAHEQLLYLFDRLNDKDRQMILDMANFLLSK
jgi:transcriptional regulator with XRE-family HTH domain